MLAGALSLLLGAAAGPVPDDDSVTVMSLNLRYAGAVPPNAWFQRRPVMRALLEQTDPDLLGTQEGVWGQLRDLDADLPDHDWIGLGREGGSRGEFMAVFYRRERFVPLAFDHYWLSDTPRQIGSKTWGNSLPRMVTWVRFRDRRTDVEFTLVNTHFDHRSEESREHSAELLLARCGQLDADEPLLVTGDFNAAAGDSAPYRILVGEGGLSDTWTTAAQRGPAVGTFHGYREPAPGGRRIDWILSRGGVETLTTEIPTFEQGGQYPSDHFPVLARVRLSDGS